MRCNYCGLWSKSIAYQEQSIQLIVGEEVRILSTDEQTVDGI